LEVNNSIQAEHSGFFADLTEGDKVEVIETADYLKRLDYAAGLVSKAGGIAHTHLAFQAYGFFQNWRQR